MDTLIDLILDNLFFVIILLLGLFNLLGSSKEKEDKRKRTEPRKVRPIPVETEPNRKTTFEQQPKMTKMEQLEAEQAEIEAKSIEEHRQEQFERLKQQFQSSYTLEDMEEMERTNVRSRREEKRESKDEKVNERVDLQLESRLSREGLVESIIMSEILGPPKARKRIKNHYMNRNV